MGQISGKFFACLCQVVRGLLQAPPGGQPTQAGSWRPPATPIISVPLTISFHNPEAHRLESFLTWRLAACCCQGELRPVPLEARGAFPRALLQAWPARTTPSRLGTRAPMSPQGCRRNALGSCKAWGVCGLPKRRLGWRVPPPHCVEADLAVVAWHRRARQGRRESPTFRHCFSFHFVAEGLMP